MFQNLLFDLDGTLTDSGEGITKSVQYALKSFGIEEPDLKKLNVFIGPPLRASFIKYYQLTPEEAEAAVEKYRERYAVTGIWENRPYDGIIELLAHLKAAGLRLGMATGKPEIFARRIADRFGFNPYLVDISGCDLHEKADNKTTVVGKALKKWDLVTPEAKATAILIGDRRDDVYSAHANGIACIGVGFGFGSYEELKEAGAEYYVKDMQELENLLLGR